MPGPRGHYFESVDDLIDPSDVVKQPSKTKSINLGRIITYGGSALKVNVGSCFRVNSLFGPRIQMLVTFNVGTDLGVSPHEPNLLQGYGIFGSVDLQIQNHEVGYELGKIVPFSKPASLGVRYNKLS